ncbi:hypothetical protein [Cysteiniphilum litorale]|uniref:hypothetical protein n=1 Tax=Cysteiniphilum litorale TaxID=2056700 RepID=UPI003F885027
MACLFQRISDNTAIDESEWTLLTDRVKDLLHGAEHALLNVDDHIEAEARRLSALVIKKHGEALFNLSSELRFIKYSTFSAPQ